MLPLFKCRKQISLNKEYEDIFASLRKLKIDVGTYTYHCANISNENISNETNNVLIFVPKAGVVLSGNSSIPQIVATVEETETDYKVNFEFSILRSVQIMVMLMALLVVILGAVCVVASVETGSLNEGVVVSSAILLCLFLISRVGLILSAKRFVNEFLYELTGK